MKYYKATYKRELKPSIYSNRLLQICSITLDHLVLTFNTQSSKDLKFRLDSLNSIDFFNEQLKIDANGEISKPYNIYQR